MAKGRKLLERMRLNPLDWKIADVESVCSAFGIACTAPRKGSHYEVKHQSQKEILTIPAHRTIKPVYIVDFVTFVDAVNGADE